MRLFFAVDVPMVPGLSPALDRLKAVQGAKVPSADSLHITLKFIGDVETDIVPSLTDALERSVADIPSFTMTLRSIGCFPDASRPRVVWAGVEDGGVMKMIADRLEEEACGLGIAAEKRGFRPHLTLARLRQPVPSLMNRFEDLSGVEMGKVKVTDVKLKSSILTPSGPRHSVIHSSILDDVDK